MAETLAIDHVGQRGDGVVFAGGVTVFVPYTLGGETVEVEPWTGIAERRKLSRIVHSSPERLAPFCPYFGTCGGCAIQHWDVGAYRRWKRDLVCRALDQAGIVTIVDDLVDAHGEGRRRIVLHARREDGGWRIGFAAAHSHEMVAIDHCPILDPMLAQTFEAAHKIVAVLHDVRKPLDIQVTATINGLDIDLRGSGALSAASAIALTRLAGQHRIVRISRHSEMIAVHAPPVLAMGKAMVTLPAGSFLQATLAGESAIAACVTDHCGKAKHIADLFCGVGPFALRLAERSRVSAFDSDAPAIAALSAAASMTSGLKLVAATARDLFRRPLMAPELRAFDAVVFDPPRQGALAQVQQLAKSKTLRVVAVSCNIATFVRDALVLLEGGYRLDRVTPIDQFRHTPHVELVACFSR